MKLFYKINKIRISIYPAKILKLHLKDLKKILWTSDRL